MAKKKGHPIFGTGPLATPLQMPTFDETFLRGTDGYSAVERAQRAKWHLLWQHYGLDPEHLDASCWQRLAIGLTFDLVPGFRTVGQRGRPPTSSGTQGRRARQDLLRMLDEIIESLPTGENHPKLTVAEAARRIKRRLNARAEPHFFKGKAVETIRHHLDLAYREYLEAQAEKEALILGQKTDLAGN